MNFTNLISPPICANCRCFGTWWCKKCQSKLCPYIHKTGLPAQLYPSLTPCYSAIEYTDTAESLVKAIKYDFYTVYVPTMAKIIDHFCAKQIKRYQPTCLVPVPLHPQRQSWRGYNQSALLAKELNKLWAIPCHSKALKRTRYRKTQASGDHQHRQKLQYDFLCVQPQLLKNQNVLLIDDVFTTGATLSACARATHRAQPNKIASLTFARTI